MLKTYGFWGCVRMVLYFLNTKLFYPNARLIRLPFEIRSRKNIALGKNLTTGFGCRIEACPPDEKTSIKTLILGENIQMNDYVHITAMTKVQIGNNVLMASKIYISDCTHGSYSGDENDSRPDSVPSERPLFSKPVIIGDNVWLGEFVSVLPGVSIGHGTIVGANSVVSKSLPANVIAVGSPAKPIKQFNFATNKWEKI